MNKFQCEIPDKDAETMINVWNPYQAERNFQFSRNISYYATGTFRGMGDNSKTAMDNVKKYLDTELGIKKIHPSMTTDYPKPNGF